MAKYGKRRYKRRPTFRRKRSTFRRRKAPARKADGVTSRIIKNEFGINSDGASTVLRVFWGYGVTLPNQAGNTVLANQPEHIGFRTIFNRYRVKGVRVDIYCP